jgi:Cu2+-exporting ATPase
MQASPFPAWIDDPREWAAFSRPDATVADHWEASLAVEGMVCAACALNVEQALRGVPGVLSAEVAAASRRARVVWDANRAVPSQWMRAVQAAGYRAVPLTDTAELGKRRSEARLALWRWLVAGLCMMQVMMYAYPAYTARAGDITPDMQQLLRWAGWLLTLPLLLFSCGPFFGAAWRDLRQRRIGMDLPVALGIAITFVVSSLATFEPGGRFGAEVYFDSLAMFVFFLLTGRWLELRLRDRTAGALDALLRRLPDGVDRLRADGQWEQVARRRIVVGDTLRVRAGEVFAADGVIVEGTTEVDEALLTGESRPLARAVGAQVLAGSHNLSGTVLVRATATAAATRFAGIARLMQSAALGRAPLVQLADRIAKPFLVAVLLAAAGACAYWWPRDPAHALMVAVAVLIVTCPCALSLATPAAMLSAAGALARRGVLVRRLQALQATARVDTVVFDKTGTLTDDAMVLGETRVRPGADAAEALALAAALARQSLHPASRALAIAQDAADARATAGSIPVHPQWTAHMVAEAAGLGLSGLVERGAQLWPGPLRLGSAQWCDLALDGGSQQTMVHLADASGWLASFSLHEQLRPDAHAAVQALRNQGIQVRLLSGDKPTPVALSAMRLGIADAHAECTPLFKLAEMQRLQRAGHVVAMVGDGLNDGPVLAAADASFAVGKAVPLTQAQADFIVQGGDLLRIPHIILLARKTMRVVRQNLAWAAGYNAVCVPLAVVGWLPAWLAGLGMAASSLLVVLNALRLARPIA